MAQSNIKRMNVRNLQSPRSQEIPWKLKIGVVHDLIDILFNPGDTNGYRGTPEVGLNVFGVSTNPTNNKTLRCIWMSNSHAQPSAARLANLEYIIHRK